MRPRKPRARKGFKSRRVSIDHLLDAGPRERDIETNWNNRAKKWGWTTIKLKSEQHSSRPDRMYLRKRVAVFIEFKREGKEATVLQIEEHDILRAQGFNVYVIDFYDKDFADLCFT